MKNIMTAAVAVVACAVVACTGMVSASAAEPVKVQSEVLVKSSDSWNGAKLPHYPQGEPEITVLRITIPAKTQLPLHKHPVINAGYLVKGQLTVIADDGKTLHVKAGDALIETVDTWHYGRNDGDTDAEIVVFYAGKPGVPLTILKP